MEKARSVQERAFYSLLVERVAAGARAGGVGVVDREALLLDRVDEVDDGAGQVRRAHPVDDDLDAAEVGEAVAVEGALVEEQLVAQAGAAPGLYRDPQCEVVATLLLEQVLHLAGRGVGQHDPGRGFGVLDGHRWRSPGALDGSRRTTPGRAVGFRLTGYALPTAYGGQPTRAHRRASAAAARRTPSLPASIAADADPATSATDRRSSTP